MEQSESMTILSDLLMKLISGEQEVERQRKYLSEHYMFNPLILFQHLRKSESPDLTPRDLKDFLEESKFTASNELIYLLIRQYSANQNGRLSFEDFSHLVLPSTDDYLSTRALNRSLALDLDYKVKFGFLTLLKSELSLQEELDSLKVALFKSQDFSLWKAFELINTSRSGYVNEQEIIDFLKGFRKYANSEDYDALMRRIDLQDDLVLCYNEFLEGLIPMQMPGNNESRVRALGTQEKVEEKEKRSNQDELFESKYEEKSENEGKDEQEANEEKGSSKDNREQSEDQPLDSQELEASPKFNDSKEFTLSKQYETPIKTKESSKVSKKGPNVVEQVKKVILKELELERKYEFLRESIIMNSNFSIAKLFEMIDQQKKSEVSMLDFEKFVDSLGIQTSRSQIILLFKRFSKEADVLLLNDLISVFLCQDEEYFDRLNNPESEDELNNETMSVVLEYFALLLEREEELQVEKFETFKKVSDDELEAAFKQIDDDGDGDIGMMDLKVMFKEAGFGVARKDIALILNRYKQGLISFEEFVENFRFRPEID